MVKGSERSECTLQLELGATVVLSPEGGKQLRKLSFTEGGLHPAEGADLAHGMDALLLDTNILGALQGGLVMQNKEEVMVWCRFQHVREV